MRVFVTGATGFIGSAIVTDLLAAGHQVLGLARSEEAARSLAAAGAEVHRGDMRDTDSLRRGAAVSDGVIHAAFDHDFSRFAENSEADRLAIEAMGEELVGSDRPLIVTAGLPVVAGRPSVEDDAPFGGGSPRVSEQAAMALAERGVRVSTVRMSQAHDRDKHGLASFMIAVAREKGVSAYVGDGRNRWSAVHRLDTAPLYRLALEKGAVGGVYHAAAEAVPVRLIAEAIGRGLNVPVEALAPENATGHFDWLAMTVGMDVYASSTLTRELLEWEPTGKPGFIADLEHSTAFQA